MVAQLDGISVDFLQAISERPRLEVAGATGMGPAKRGEYARLQPSGVQFGAGNGPNPSDIGAGELETRKPHVIEHGHAQPQVVPGSPVIATPLGRITLPASVGSAGNDQG